MDKIAQHLLRKTGARHTLHHLLAKRAATADEIVNRREDDIERQLGKSAATLYRHLRKRAEDFYEDEGVVDSGVQPVPEIAELPDMQATPKPAPVEAQPVVVEPPTPEPIKP